MKLTESAKRAIREEATKCSVPFEQTQGERATYPSCNGLGGDFFDAPIVIVRRIPEGRIARMFDGAHTLLPDDFPVEAADDATWARAVADCRARKGAT